jgi:hypothetical protein
MVLKFTGELLAQSFRELLRVPQPKCLSSSPVSRSEHRRQSHPSSLHLSTFIFWIFVSAYTRYPDEGGCALRALVPLASFHPSSVTYVPFRPRHHFFRLLIYGL